MREITTGDNNRKNIGGVQMRTIETLDEKGLRDLLKVYAINWLAHDGCWFQSCEFKWDMAMAKSVNDATWERFAGLEAERILKFLGRKPGEGLDALEEALGFRLYASVNRQEIVQRTSMSFIFRMRECRVQAARERKGMQPYPCKSGGIAEYTNFAKAVDSRIMTRCLGCPPDPLPPEWFCAWEFSLETDKGSPHEKH